MGPEDGKELNLECDRLTCQTLIEEVDRHSRALQKEATLNE
jgi:large subunit ribosomal protein L53